MVRRMRKTMGAYASTASQPQIMATNNAFKIVLLNVNFTATAAKNPVATAPVQLCYRLAPSVYRGSIIAVVSSSIKQEAKELGSIVASTFYLPIFSSARSHIDTFNLFAKPIASEYPQEFKA